MICNKCNKEIEDGVKFCTNCGVAIEVKDEKLSTTVVPAVDKKEEKPSAATAPAADKKEETLTTVVVTPAVNKKEEKPKKKAEKSSEKIVKNVENATLPSTNEEKIEQKPEEKAEEKADKKQLKTDKKAEKAEKKNKKDSEKEKALIVPQQAEKQSVPVKVEPIKETVAVEENINKEAKVKEKKKKAPKKSKDRVNFFLLVLSLCCPPYFGVLITICTSAKAPKASQVYGVFTILSFIFMKVKNYILTAIATLCVIFGALAVVIQGVLLVLAELGYNITLIPIPGL